LIQADERSAHRRRCDNDDFAAPRETQSRGGKTSSFFLQIF
jgi:hypothetical protein